MLLVAGGQLDPNIGRILRSVLKRRIPFADLLIGPNCDPSIEIREFGADLLLNGTSITPTCAFVRHDVFLHQQTGESLAATCALNWYYCIRGWTLANKHVRTTNRRGNGSENNKFENLVLASQCGLNVPETLVANDLTQELRQLPANEYIQKPVAGGDYTTLLSGTDSRNGSRYHRYPRFIQRTLHRPELRVYTVGEREFGFHIESPETDYRVSNSAKVSSASIPPYILSGLRELNYKLGLDFSAADFMFDPREKEYKFLEVNTQPMFAAFDICSEGAIADALLDFLCVEKQNNVSS